MIPLIADLYIKANIRTFQKYVHNLLMVKINNKPDKYTLIVSFLNKVWESTWKYSSTVEQVYTITSSLLYHRQQR